MSHLPQIDPLTTGQLKVTVKDATGAVVLDATSVASVYQPSGKRVASAVSMAHVGSGVYVLTVLASWSDAGSGVPLRGVYEVIVTVTRSGLTRTKRMQYLVDFL